MRWATVARYGGVGDNLVASSVLPGLRARYDRVEVISQAPQSAVFENNPHVDKLSVYRRDEIPAQGWQEWHRIRARENGPDGLFVNLSHSMETLLAFVPAQCQFQWPAAARRRLADKSYLEQVHDICGVPYSEIAPGFYPTDEERRRAADIRGHLGMRVIGWVITGTRVDKIYPFSAMAVARLIADLGADVVLFGHPEKDRENADAIYEHVVRQNGSSRGLHYARSADPAAAAWPLRDVLTLVQMCDLVVGPDTGPMWAVATSDVPKIVLLSHASPTNITKHWRATTALHANQVRVPCWPCHQLHDVPDTCTPNRENRGAACISDISVEDIVRAAERHLAGHVRPASPAPAPIISFEDVPRGAPLLPFPSLPLATTTVRDGWLDAAE